MSFQLHHTPGGYTTVRTAVIPEGILRVEDTYQVLYTEGHDPAGAMHILRTAWLGGELITDPAEAQRLYDKADWT
jgi:hypothetical protein